MAKTASFEAHAREYDAWFSNHTYVYYAELEALKRLLPKKGVGVEIGVGTGRFALPLGAALGVDPSPAMRQIAAEKGLETVDGVAEALPLEDDKYDYALFVTTICFLDSLHKAFAEAYRVLRPNGVIVVGFIDKDSVLGKRYATRGNESVFYKDAVFYSVPEVRKRLQQAGFTDFVFVQTLFEDLHRMRRDEPIKDGFGEGSFVVVRGKKCASP